MPRVELPGVALVLLCLAGGGRSLLADDPAPGAAPEGAAQEPPSVPVPSPREFFLAGLAALEDASPGEFPTRLAAWVDGSLSAGAGEPPDRAQERRRSFLAGAGALFDAGDTLRNLPILGRAFDGIVLEAEKERRDAVCARARLHGRHDAPKHFFIAAALTARGGPAAAAQASLVKEMEDARRFDDPPARGSGFSFIDLAYDHAGIRFANLLLGWRDVTRLSLPPPPLDGFLVPFTELDLPERIGWQRYRDEYRGARTSELIDRIHVAVDERLRERGAAPAGGIPTGVRDGPPPAIPPNDRNGQSP